MTGQGQEPLEEEARGSPRTPFSAALGFSAPTTNATEEVEVEPRWVPTPHFGEGCSVPGAAQSILLTSFPAPQPSPLGVSWAGLGWSIYFTRALMLSTILF